MKYRKKPIVIEATQWFKHGDHPAVKDMGAPVVLTLEGPLHVTPGDWIITGVKGEHYPCKPDVFAATYEPAENTITAPEGWQMVPLEPTREMLSATSWPSCAATDYKHMLAAAPKPGDSNEWMAELAARLRAMTTATMLDEYDMKAAADLIDSMAQRVPLSDEQIYQVIEAARESYRAHTTGIRGQMLTIYDDMDWHLVRAVEQVHGIKGGRNDS